MYSTDLRSLLERHFHDIEFMAGTWALEELVRNSCNILATAPWHQHTRGTWTHRVHDWLSNMGWEPQQQQWHYKHPQCGHIHLDNVANHDQVQSIKHQLRETWRRKLFHRFKAHNRRDARERSNWQYSEKRCSIACNTYNKTTGEGKAVLTGGGCSVAYYGKRKNNPYTYCPLCKAEETPAWQHSMWHCPYFTGRPSKTSTPEAQRLGWPEANEPPENHLSRVSWMAGIKKVLHDMFGFHSQHR